MPSDPLLQPHRGVLPVYTWRSSFEPMLALSCSPGASLSRAWSLIWLSQAFCGTAIMMLALLCRDSQYQATEKVSCALKRHFLCKNIITCNASDNPQLYIGLSPQVWGFIWPRSAPSKCTVYHAIDKSTYCHPWSECRLYEAPKAVRRSLELKSPR